jgi:hypothetical protein
MLFLLYIKTSSVMEVGGEESENDSVDGGLNLEHLKQHT